MSRKSPSGEHPITLAYRAKQDSFADGVERMRKAREALEEACAAAKASTIPAPPEPEPA